MDTKNYRVTIQGEPIKEDEKFLKVKDVVEFCCISRPMIYKLMEANKFPPCHRISGRVFWLATDINIWRSMTPEHFYNEYGAQLKAKAEGAAA
ncbi:helix-turn-helix transcriptional regulator [Pseudoalteromonas lipolytica]|uniref:helix-turn-helix transcriptional regulator n=1 Tax=Pseudoalteromonas lipolytica TaxID=570156 RepID=UPI0008250E0C|nr:AlpA family phage regulatory protein [Pseudoalteromonas lipolytica]